MIYEPAEDSWMLEEEVKKYAKGKVLDMGCGSGIQALAALENTKDVLAADINEEAVKYCKDKGINAVSSDLFEQVTGKFDLIIFNPPYLPGDPQEPRDSALATTGGKKGNEVLARFLKKAKDYLIKDGKILIVVSSLTPKVETLIKKNGFMFVLLKEKKIDWESLKVYLIYP